MTPSRPEKIIFIDRDGVINVDPIGDYVKSWSEFKFEKGVLEALKKISDLGYGIIIVSNQAGIGDGVYSERELWKVHDQMLKEFEKRKIRIRSSHYCLHGKQAGCGCRKPELGLFREAVKGISFDPAKTFFIGDKVTDIEAGKKLELKTILVRTGHGRFDESKAIGALTPDFIVDDLKKAVGLLS